MARKTLYGILIGEPGSTLRDETISKIESLGFLPRGDPSLTEVRGRLLKVSPKRFESLSSDPDFKVMSIPEEDMALLVLNLPEESEEERMISLN